MNTTTKLWIHITISLLTAIGMGLQGYKEFSEVPSMIWFFIFLNTMIQCLNSAKAFFDQSSTRDQINNETSTITTQLGSISPDLTTIIDSSLEKK